MSTWLVDIIIVMIMIMIIVIIMSMKHHITLQVIVASLASSVPLAITETSGTGGPQLTMMYQCNVSKVFWLPNPESASYVPMFLSNVLLQFYVMCFMFYECFVFQYFIVHWSGRKVPLDGACHALAMGMRRAANRFHLFHL